MKTDILFFDLPTTLPGPVSPNTWKVRLALNIKKLHYTTEWLPTSKIEQTLKPLGIKPTGVRPDGSPRYTLPAIVDRTVPDNVVALADSTPIIEYLEKIYPTPGIQLIPANTAPLIHFFEHHFYVNFVQRAYFNLLVVASRQSRPENERMVFQALIERTMGKPLDQMEKQGGEREVIWKDLEKTLGFVADCSAKAEGPFLLGPSVSLVDCHIAGALILIKSLSPIEGWGKISSWENGRWSKFLGLFEDFMTVDNYPA